MGNNNKLSHKSTNEIEPSELRPFDRFFMRDTNSERLKSLPTTVEFRERQQFFLTAPIGSLDFDVVAERVFGEIIDGCQPPLMFRELFAEAFSSAYSSAATLYIERDIRSARLKRIEAIEVLRHAVDEFVSEYDMEMLLLDIMPFSVEKFPNWTVLDEARKFSSGLKNMETYFSDLNTVDTHAPASDLFKFHLVDEMRKVWCEILGRKQRHGDGERIIDITMAAGLDMGMFNGTNGDKDLRGTIKKWFNPKKET